MDFKEIELPYGKTVLKAKIPKKNLAYVLTTKHVSGLKNEAEAITRSLRSPTGCPQLLDCIKKNDRVIVIVTDNTRACPDDRIVPPILAELGQKVPRDNITIIIALGLHAPLDKEALIKKLGKDIVANYRVINHDVNQTVNIGTTSRGTPVDINEHVVEADFRISTGFIEPHFFAVSPAAGKALRQVSSASGRHIKTTAMLW